MLDISVRLAVLLLLILLAVVLVWLGRRAIEAQRILGADPVKTTAAPESKDVTDKDLVPPVRPAPVRILAFSSEECVQFRQMQAPVLRRVVEAKGEDVIAVMIIDAPTSPELTQRYHVIILPTTVLLDTHGQAHAINYGFTNAQSLLKQVDAILALENAQEALS